jgi:ubiquinone/menaquinone biosynthesis C-methylase UbiE
MNIANYDDKTYEYKDYWKHRDYENISENIALRKLLPQRGESIIDVGGGFGRLIPLYKNRFNGCTVFDYSQKLLDQATESCAKTGIGNVKCVQGDVYKISEIVKQTYDCVLIVRVCHHLMDLDKAVSELSKITKSGGTLIFEFANKLHFKSVMANLLKGNFNYSNEEPVSRATKDVVFLNFHPAYAEKLLIKHGFKIEDRLSVSNFRLGFLKDIVPISILAFLEDALQCPLAIFNFGPSIFLKCKKN